MSDSEFDLQAELRTLELFESWVDQQPRGEIGLARNSCECPLSKFLTTQFDARVVVACDRIGIGDGMLHHSRLSREFVRWLDDGHRDNQPVTKAEVKQAIKAAKQRIQLDN